MGFMTAIQQAIPIYTKLSIHWWLLLQIQRFIQSPSSDNSTENNKLDSRIWEGKNTNKQNNPEFYKIGYNTVSTLSIVTMTPFHPLPLNTHIGSPWYSMKILIYDKYHDVEVYHHLKSLN